MYRFYTFVFRFFIFTTILATNNRAFAQPNSASRIYVDSSLAPFYHGVASGDAVQNSVFIWTRITTDAANPEVQWRVATDTSMTNVVQSGSVSTSADNDYTIKVEATGLQPGTYYFYEFKYDEKYSLRGRTKTLPSGDVNQVRLGVVSCSSFPHGYFNVYQVLNQRNDVDAIVHLGDYIYEYGKNEYGTTRVPEPENEILTLADYRLRHNMYKLDSMLMRLHQQYPFYTIWDDHEFADNAYESGAENHTATNEGDWQMRKMAALRAYNEWMPIRTIDTVPAIRLYRKFSIGNLADLFFIDTRITARNEQSLAASITGIDDTSHYLIGPEQFDWLRNGLRNSSATWKLIANQVMVAPFKVFNVAFNNDQWDGYPSERRKFFDMINNEGINNLVVLTGDIHSAWANDLPFGRMPYVSWNGKGSVGVEFVSTAVTSPGIPLTGILGNITQDAFSQIIRENNPHVKHNNFVNRGFDIIDINPQRCQGDFYNIGTIETPNFNYSHQTSYYTERDSNHLKKSLIPSNNGGLNTVKGPRFPRQQITTSVKNYFGAIEITAVYPNPFINYTGIQFSTNRSANLNIYVYSATGQLVYVKDLGSRPKGVYFEKLDIADLPKGQYVVCLYNGEDIITRTVVKAE
ncbi:MAG: alkaline phosphatase D family protein [Sphingobacteriales bacterium]|nr:alkaline phosphatase D family protein [Sphingobacteriales bacterium]